MYICFKSNVLIGLITARTIFRWILLYGHLKASWDLKLHIVYSLHCIFVDYLDGH